VFIHIAEVLDGGKLIELIEAMVLPQFVEGRNDRWGGVSAFDVF